MTGMGHSPKGKSRTPQAQERGRDVRLGVVQRSTRVKTYVQPSVDTAFLSSGAQASVFGWHEPFINQHLSRATGRNAK